MNDVDEASLREDIVAAMRAMDARGLNRGTSGNVSVRAGDAMLVTPSGIPPAQMHAGQIVRVAPDGSWRDAAGLGLRPSSEWQMHWGILSARPDVAAVVHCHSHYATVLACAHKPIPSLHYMVAVGGGRDVPVAPYRSFGTPDLATVTADVLGGRNAVLMANHGQIAVGRNLAMALAIAEEIENQAAVYVGTLLIGGPQLLDAAEMDVILGRFRSGYGQAKKEA